MCINGVPQWAYTSKEEVVLSTVLTESTFIMATIASDATSVFLNTDVDEDVRIVLKEELANKMVQIAPQVYRKYVTVNRKGTPIVHVKL